MSMSSEQASSVPPRWHAWDSACSDEATGWARWGLAGARAPGPSAAPHVVWPSQHHETGLRSPLAYRAFGDNTQLLGGRGCGDSGHLATPQFAGGGSS